MMTKLDGELKVKLFPENCVIQAYRGSVAHNMYMPNTDPNSVDDIDLMGVYLAPAEYYIGLGFEKNHERATERFVGKYDAVSYEFRRFVRLLLKSNPNTLGLLWLRDNHYLQTTEAGRLLIDNRSLFVSTLAYKTFTGYAYGQFKDMARGSSKGYMGTRRKALVEKYGYDIKNAAHCIRLLRMGMEYLKTGELHVFREDASQLLEIKRGEWALDQVRAEAKRLFNLTDEAYVRSKLPTKPNYEKVEQLVMEVLSNHVGV